MNIATPLDLLASNRVPNRIPYLCWSRMQAEAGQGLDVIIARKELERRASGGLFMWGVGNAPSTAISALARLGTHVPVVFSIMKSRPKAEDLSPARIFAWRRYIDAQGIERELPAHTLVTSRGDTAGGPKRVHYALMCSSSNPLALRKGEAFDVSAYRNAGGRGAPVGASQVTALLRQVAKPAAEASYEANLNADLTESYWVRLLDPVEVLAGAQRAIANAGDLDVSGWCDLVDSIRQQGGRDIVRTSEPYLF